MCDLFLWKLIPKIWLVLLKNNELNIIYIFNQTTKLPFKRVVQMYSLDYTFCSQMYWLQTGLIFFSYPHQYWSIFFKKFFAKLTEKNDHILFVLQLSLLFTLSGPLFFLLWIAISCLLIFLIRFLNLINNCLSSIMFVSSYWFRMCQSLITFTYEVMSYLCSEILPSAYSLTMIDFQIYLYFYFHHLTS